MISQPTDEDIELEAIKELLSKLERPEQLSYLQRLKDDYEKQFEASQAQLHSLVQTTNDDMRFAFEQIRDCVALMGTCRENFREVDRLGVITKTLLPEHNEIRKYSVARKNMNTTWKIIEEFRNINGKALALMDKLKAMEGDNRDRKADREIQKVYMNLRHLCKFRNQLWREGENYALEFRKLIQRNFEVLNQVQSKLKTALRYNIEDTLILCTTDPTTLIYTLKIIEWEDRAKTKVFTEWNVEKPYKAGQKNDGIMFAQATVWLSDCIEENLKSSGETIDECENIQEKFKVLDEVIEELEAVHTRVVLCYPPKWNIVNFYQKRYRYWLVEKIVELSANTTDLTQGDTLRLASWIQKFEKILIRLEGARNVPQELKDAVLTLGESLRIKSQDSLTQPVRKVFKMVKNDEPNKKDNGKLNTFGPRDLFSLINNHFSTAKKKYGSGEAMIEIARLYGTLLNNYQRQMINYLRTAIVEDDKIFLEGKEKTEEFLVAWLSSGMRYEEVTDRLQEMILSKLKRPTGSIDNLSVKDDAPSLSYEMHLREIIKITKAGFRKVADEVLEILCAYVMKLLKDGEPFQCLFSDIWMQDRNKMEDINNVLMQEIADSLNLYIEWNEWEEYSKKLTSKMLKSFVQTYFLQLMREKPRVSEQFIRNLILTKQTFQRRVRNDKAFSSLGELSQENAFDLFDAFEKMLQVQDAFELDTHFPSILKCFEGDAGYIIIQQLLRMLPGLQSKDKQATLERFKSLGYVFNEKKESKKAELEEALTLGSIESGFYLDISFPRLKKQKPQHMKGQSSQQAKFLKMKSWFGLNDQKGAEKKADMPPTIIEEKQEVKNEEETEVINMEDFLDED